MKRLLGILILIFVLCPLGMGLAASDPRDVKGSKDHPLFNRMPNYFIYSYQEKEFDRYEFPAGDNKKTAVEGHYYRISYVPDKNKGAVPSQLQIIRNHVNAAKAIGGQVIYTSKNETEIVLKIAKKGMETWVHVVAQHTGGYFLFIIEKQLMEQDVTANADSMAASIKNTGKAAIYGIYFDSGKAEIKPESEPALNEIVKLLQADPKLKLYVVGHTDNVGTYDYNVNLSKERADAVVKVLTGKYGIAVSRLLACGDGPAAPVESNRTEEGRAKNRRVELVEQ